MDILSEWQFTKLRKDEHGVPVGFQFKGEYYWRKLTTEKKELRVTFPAHAREIMFEVTKREPRSVRRPIPIPGYRSLHRARSFRGRRGPRRRASLPSYPRYLRVVHLMAPPLALWPSVALTCPRTSFLRDRPVVGLHPYQFGWLRGIRNSLGHNTFWLRRPATIRIV
jgi:hypothetical protein